MNIKNIKHKLHKLSHLLVTLPLAGGVMSGALTSCSDWSDHYEDGNGAAGSNSSLWEVIQSKPELSDFAEVLNAISITRQHKKTSTTYAEQIMGGRTFTLLAPVNGTFNKDSIIAATQTNSGDSAVEKLFAMNHLLSAAYSIGGGYDNKKLLLLNKKYANFNGSSINGIPVREANIKCKNGVMHILEKPLPYSYTIYEALTNLPEFKEGAGKVLQKYNRTEFDEAASTPNGSKDGMTVYIDSVYKDINKMLDELAPITDIDSTYYVTVPSKAGWDRVWKKVTSAYKFSNSETLRDSLQENYSYRAIMEDAIYSMTTLNGKQNDSIISVKYRPGSWGFDPRYHVFQKPLEKGGVLYGADKIIDCANGKIYCMNDWSLDPTKTYHKEIKLEGEEYEAQKVSPCPDGAKYTSSDKGATPEIVRDVPGDSISKGAFARFVLNTNWAISYKIDNTLSSKYDVKLVVLPTSVVKMNDSKLPVKFKTTLTYFDENDKPLHQKVSKDFISDPLHVDTITVFEDFEFPMCNYNLKNNKVALTIETTVGLTDGKKYSRVMYLDAIIFTPKED